MTKECQSSNDEFGFCHSSFFRHSSFVIRHSKSPIARTGIQASSRGISFDAPKLLCYKGSMTTTLSIRLAKAKKDRIRKQAKPNINAWINAVLDRALKEKTVDWE